MKSIRNIAPALMVLVLIIGIALVVGLASRGGQAPEAVAREDAGPNASLSNDELVSEALENMAALNGDRFDFTALEPAGAVTSTRVLSMTGYEQMPGKGLKAKMWTPSEVSEDDIGASGLIRVLVTGLRDPATGRPMPVHVMVLGQEPKVYMAAGDGTDWRQLSGQDYANAYVAFLCSWDDTSKVPSCGGIIKGSKFEDVVGGSGVIDGVPVRHLTSDLLKTIENWPQDVPAPQGPMFTSSPMESAKLSIWVSTDAAPTIRQMRIEVVPAAEPAIVPAVEQEPYSLTWTWSRFNDDSIEDIQPPAPEKIKQP